MKAFELVRPSSLDAALELLPRAADRDRIRVVAGGQDLYTEMQEHLAEPEQLIELKSLGDLGRIEVDAAGNLVIGALARLADLAEHKPLRTLHAGVAEAAESIASPQIRNVGTIGGNLNQRPRCAYYRHEGAKCLKKGGTECFSYAGHNKYNAILGGGPSYIVHPSDLAPALICAGAEVVLAKKGSTRRMPLEKYFTLPTDGDVLRETVLASDEILTHVHLPAPPPGWRSVYLKFKERASYDFALASVAAGMARGSGGVSHARLVLGAVAPIPWRVPAAEQRLIGSNADAVVRKEAAELALRGAEPLSQNGYKVALTKNLVQRALGAIA